MRATLKLAVSVAVAMGVIGACAIEAGDEQIETTEPEGIGEARQALEYTPLTVVRTSVKVLVDDNGRWPTGDFDTRQEIDDAFARANETLFRSNADWRLSMTELVEVGGLDDWWDMACGEIHGMEQAAQADPAGYVWRNDAINFYVVHDLADGCGGVCSFPDDPGDSQEIITIQSFGGIKNRGDGWLHEVGHYFSLFHTFSATPGCVPPPAPWGWPWGDRTCKEAGGGGIVGPFQCCQDVCPQTNNVMSYNAFAAGTGELTPCQLNGAQTAMTNERPHVIEQPQFIRGDVNGDGDVNITDAININMWLFQDGNEPGCMEAADTNNDGVVDISDTLYLLGYLFLGYDPLDAPGAAACAPADARDEHFLGCAVTPCLPM